jgi:hypothetical protein
VMRLCILRVGVGVRVRARVRMRVERVDVCIVWS